MEKRIISLTLSVLLAHLLPLILFGLTLAGRSNAQPLVTENRHEIPDPGKQEFAPWTTLLQVQSGNPFSSKEGRFSIKLPPGFPALELKEETAATAVGNIEVHNYNSGTSQGFCIVSYSDYPPVSFQGRTAQKILEDARDGALGSVKGTLEKQANITVQGHPALVFYGAGDSSGKTFYVMFEYVLVQPRVYQVGYLTDDRAGLEKPEVQAYFKSFRLEE